ncbi:MAG: hypothetical protein CM15mV28_1790 [Thaumasvirus sp.]|nr:MAG: hypothetical protein CM15mV28_1790 [Thaumasvirus sp.]
MNKIYAAMIIGAVAWCAASAEACVLVWMGEKLIVPPFF